MAHVSQHYLKSLHEGLGSGLCDGSQVIDEVSLGHADSSVNNGQCAFMLVGNDVNLEVLPTVQFRWISQTFISDFVKGLQHKKDKNTFNFSY